MLSTFDHATIVARKLEATMDRYQTLLGSPPIWQGSHPELGTIGALFALPNGLIELTAPDGNAPEADGLREWIETRGEGLQSIAFGTDDADACTAVLRERGIRATEPQPGEAHGRDGSIRRYRTVDLSPRATRGLFVLAVERPEPKLHPQAAPSPLAADALDHVVIMTGDAEAAIGLYGRGLGVRLALDRELASRRMLFFRIGGVTIEVVTDPSAGATDTFGGLAFRVRDIDGANARLRAAGLDVSEVRQGAKPGTRVFTVRNGTCGVPTLILRDPARDVPASTRPPRDP